MPYGFTKEQLEASVERHTQEIARLIAEHAEPDRIYKIRKRLESVLGWLEELRKKGGRL